MSSEATTDAVVFDQLNLKFGPLHLYEGLSLRVHRGETLGLIGRSGTGKSVLLKCALRLLVPDFGAIHTLGVDVLAETERSMVPLRKRVGIMFQNYALFDSLTVKENIAWPLRIEGWKDEQAIAERVAETLESVNMPGIEEKMPAELSGGMKKRVSLARAVVDEPELLFYDGPTTGLDPANAKRVDSIIERLKAERGVTAILVTHDMRTIDSVADRVAMLHDRRVIWAGPPTEMRTQAPKVVRDFVTGNFRGEYDPARVRAMLQGRRASRGS
ncbi:MAG: ATP-binding cassette domain-containing protein [Deltaproteobacteria bacterium]|nr:ATP-binding cassette domain-containing protein [Deltaproteobacteria bacterium]